jgi:hypothetical protein
MLAGGSVSIQEVMGLAGVGYPQAAAYIKLTEEMIGAESYRDGMIKRWKLDIK